MMRLILLCCLLGSSSPIWGHITGFPAMVPGSEPLPLLSHMAMMPSEAHALTPPTVGMQAVTTATNNDSLYLKYPRARAWKKRGIAIGLCALLGWAGVHRYYMGAKKFWLVPGYLALNVLMWGVDLVALSVNGRESMDRFLYNDRFFAGMDL